MNVDWFVIGLQCLLAFCCAFIGSSVGAFFGSTWLWRRVFRLGRRDAFRSMALWHGRLAAASTLGKEALEAEIARLVSIEPKETE
jgi:hypothetical protein